MLTHVKHGLVEFIKDWPYSTFHALVEKGVYPPHWRSDDVLLSASDLMIVSMRRMACRVSFEYKLQFVDGIYPPSEYFFNYHRMIHGFQNTISEQLFTVCHSYNNNVEVLE